jgi:uncharacterized DUF497 family protein
MITFGPAKRDRTLRDRGLDFADAAQIFTGLHATAVDDRKDYGERRYISAGVLGGRVVVIAWTLRGNARHVISMRFCHAKEAKRWRQAIEALGR